LRITVALGGNAILRRGDAGTADEQRAAVEGTAQRIVSMLRHGDRVLVTHGNGPQVGDILLKNELAKDVAPPMPLDVCGAESQGMLGYLLGQALTGALKRAHLKIPVATVLTTVVVSESDRAFRKPSKPVGPFYDVRQARSLKRRGWRMKLEPGKGYRRVVPSPIPLDVVEKDTISMLFRSGTLVIAGGGGGVPVVMRKHDGYVGVEGVVDKDRTSALLASAIKSDVHMILTDVDCVYLRFGTKGQRPLRKVDALTMKKYLKEGYFAEGSMAPKVESALGFLESGGQRAVIGSLDRAEDALSGRSGTTIVP